MRGSKESAKGLVICKPTPAGSTWPDEHYSYSGSHASLVRLSREQVPQYEAVDDGDPPNVYQLPYQHGWLLEFRPLFRPANRWIVFARDGKLYLDDGSSVLSISDEDVTVRVRRFGCLVRVRVALRAARRAEQFWIRIPLMRLIFWDPVVSVDQCEPVCELFGDMQELAGMECWRERFSSGVAHRSNALTFVRSVES